MRTLAISHQRDAGPGVFTEAAAAAGHELDVWHVAESATPPADPLAYGAVMTFGGSMHPDQVREYPWLGPEIGLLGRLLARRVPVLGVCLGSQLLARAAGGQVARASEPEIGWHPVELTDAGAVDPVLGALAPRFEAFQWHSYECRPPAAAELLATSPVCGEAYRLGDRVWGIQFHAEVSAADAAHWIDDYKADPDAVRIGVDPVALGAQTSERIDAWNALGRGLCERFLARAAQLQPR